ncbi:hypothetical protein NB640_01520 [Oxalobacter vibrioformis]|uniref:Uncharacterized protein n=1 Tax=Oxalobacter vibrioformis TaxID=933080 RepID=A0A9E9LZF0_9BURK|nr:hypothetical protein [Oxalobacter vibrioformis]WAW10372.1 hypothetical protein NB640_01520 [Oxalobacter vibrioformis]
MDEKTAIRTINWLRRLDEKNEMEMEDLLALVKKPSPLLAKPLRNLSRDADWQGLNDRLIIPFVAWADVVCAYCENGLSAIIAMARKRDHLSHLALAVLETLNNQESAEVLADLLEDTATTTYQAEYLKKLTSTFNLVVSFGKTIRLDEKDCKRSNQALSTILTAATSSGNTTLQACCLYAFRGTGDKKVIDLLKKQPDLPEPWGKTKKDVIRHIQKRIKSQNNA